MRGNYYHARNCLAIPNLLNSAEKPCWRSHIALPCDGCQLQSPLLAQTIAGMDNQSQTAASPLNPFGPGTMVVATLANPREKFWGAILSLNAEGLRLRGIELPSFEALVALVKDGEPFSLGVVFFPMPPVERMELDLPDGNIPSLSQRFTAKAGLDPVTLLRSSSPVDVAK